MKGGTIATIIILLCILAGGWYFFNTYMIVPQKEVVGTGNAPGTTTAGSSDNELPTGGMETGTIPDITIGTSTEKDFTVTAYDFGFNPNTISVAKGDHVVVTVNDSGGIHNFVIDELGVATPRLGTGESTTTAFDANRIGTFQYYSSVGNDRANGMWGTFRVTQ